MRKVAVGLAILTLLITASGCEGIGNAVNDVAKQVGLGDPDENSAVKKLEQAQVHLDEQKSNLQRQLSSLAAEIALSDVFQKQLESLAAQFNQAKGTPEEETLKIKLRAFFTYRARMQRLSELGPKIEQALVAARFDETGDLQVIDDIIKQVEIELKTTELSQTPVPELPTSDSIPTIMPTPTANYRVIPSPDFGWW